jgi:hypothetical protein
MSSPYTDVIEAARRVDDWWTRNGVERAALRATPACIFELRKALAALERYEGEVRRRLLPSEKAPP